MDDAGPFGAWLGRMQAALRGEADADVPCGECTACCTSAQFVHIAPDETETLARIPAALLFPAPRLPEGHVVLGYDERGHCPMLRDGGCSIYDHRPRTCRVYDCRVFSAAGVAPTEPAKHAVAERVRTWQFAYADDGDRSAHEALKQAVAAGADPVAAVAAAADPPTAFPGNSAESFPQSR